MKDSVSYGLSFVLALLVHLALAALLLLGTWNWRPEPTRTAGLTISATVVDAEQLNSLLTQANRAQQREQRLEERNQALAAQQERERRQAAEREQRLQAEQRRQAEQREAEALAEQQRQQALARQQAEEEARRKQAEEQRRRELAAQRRREREEAQRKALEEELRKQNEELAKLRRQQLEKEQQVEQERRRMERLQEQRKAEEAAEEERRRQQLLAEEQYAAAQAQQLGTLGDQYVLDITEIVTRNWLRPPTAESGLRCRLRIRQIPGGDVVGAEIVSSACNADQATQRSIVAAVNRASPLPYRGYEKVFEKEIEFVFIYDGD